MSLTIKIKRAAFLTIWPLVPVSVKGALYLRHRKQVQAKIANGTIYK